MRIALAGTLVLLGLALLSETVAGGGGTAGLAFGVLLLAAGAGRLYLLRGR